MYKPTYINALLLLSSAAEQMDQVSNRSGVGSDDITDDTSLPDLRWSSDEDVRKKIQLT